MGTPGYLAPEQVRDASTIDARADVFALGSIAYEMMCGQPTFADESGHVGVQSTLEREPPPLRSRVEVSEAIAQAIHRSLAKDLELRFPNVLEFAAALFVERPDLLQAIGQGRQPRALTLSLPTIERPGASRSPAPTTYEAPKTSDTRPT
jgi:serine/threonine protein kinase